MSFAVGFAADEGRGFDPQASYQMVPLFDTRRISVLTGEGEPWTLVLPDSGRVSITSFRRVRGGGPSLLPVKPMLPCKIALEKNSEFELEIFGLECGKLELSLLRGAAPCQRLIVSVKRPIQRQFFLIQLADLRVRTNSDENETLSLMATVSEIYRRQCNVTFRHTGSDFRVVMAVMGDPLDVFEESAFQNETKSNLQRIIDTTPRDAFLGTLNFFCLYRCWNLRGTADINGVTVRGEQFQFRLVFIEDAAKLSTFVHEIGHAHGLEHDRDPLNFMFTPFNNKRFRFRMSQVDTINPTGLDA